MQFRKEILRGVRLAAILFAVLLAGLTSYRMLRVAPAAAQKQETQQAAQPTPPVAPATSETPHPAAASAEVPPPPPTTNAARAPVRRTPRQTAAAVPSVVVMKDVEAVITAHPEGPSTVEAVLPPPPAIQEPVQPPAIGTTAKADIPPPPADSAPKSGPRGKRLLRSFGRLLHVGGKKDSEAQPESVAQQ